ncbi:MAG: hypothetical protein JRF63_08885 [Deltaproteobacteria bacterium]|nr:hypothetical protein [Deltaproteobacteria bacterium]
MKPHSLVVLSIVCSAVLFCIGCFGSGEQPPGQQQQPVAPGYPAAQPQPVAPGYPAAQPQPVATGQPAPQPQPVASQPAAPAPIQLTADTCRVSQFSSPVKIGSAVRHMGKGEWDFAANQGHSCLIYGDVGGPWSSDSVQIRIIDGQGRVIAERETIAERLEFAPSVVAAPWGGFVVSYRWTNDANEEADRLVARTVGYDGNWTDKGWVISGRTHGKGLRLRNYGDKVGIWWQELSPNGKVATPSYAEVVNRVRQAATFTGLPTFPLQDPSWRPKLEAVTGWPIPAGAKGARIRWDGSKFVISWKTVAKGGYLFDYKWFSATCG